MFAHFRAPIKISADGEAAAGTGAPVLSYIKLPLPVAAFIKLTQGRRMKHKISMPDRSGYVCILSGIADLDELPALSRNAALERALTVLNLDGRSISSPQLFDNPLQWLRPSGQQPLRPLKAKIAAVLHLYYQELWPELAAFLSQIQHPFDLWITHCGMDSTLRTQILENFPQAQFVQVENCGRDIWPFISLLNDNVFKGYGCICKIHGKKSAHKPGQEETLLGSRWRRRALYDLLACWPRRAHREHVRNQPKLRNCRAQRIASAQSPLHYRNGLGDGQEPQDNLAAGGPDGRADGRWRSRFFRGYHVLGEARSAGAGPAAQFAARGFSR